VSEEGPAAALMTAAVERFGRVDILVNNVGRSRYAKIREMSVAVRRGRALIAYSGPGRISSMATVIAGKAGPDE
jgi:NAD(P)-dependent dehydrogenase (short-subunit alcohol dehydrogenase family)